MKYKTIYGLIEVSIGVMIALSKIKEYWTVQPVSTDFIVGYVTASIYLIVRGCDNLHQGFKSGSKDPIAKRVHDFIYC
ncbi:MAG: hypothetical protein IPH93_10365 [Saprospiraceae bacterium]|nr:hypothetical protein [Saprospiraceae bacterium]